MIGLWNKAKSWRSKYHNHRIWLVWTIGQYANDCPWIELRAVYTKKVYADSCANSIRKTEVLNYRRIGSPYIDRVYIEPRVTNHQYGKQMMELAAHLKEL